MQAARAWSSIWRNGELFDRNVVDDNNDLNNFPCYAILFSSKILLAVTKTARRNYGGGHNTRMPKMNDMPVPEGDFMQTYANRQRRYNTVLAIGMCSSGFGLFLVRLSNWLLGIIWI